MVDKKVVYVIMVLYCKEYHNGMVEKGIKGARCMESRFTNDARKLQRDKKTKKIVKITLLILLMLLTLSYFVFGIIYNSGNFSITLDKNLYFERGLIIYDDLDYKVYRTELYAKGPDTFDNISYRWLPSDMTNTLGEHNGDNYLAYTFYIENIGENIVDYWSQVMIDDVIKNVDEAVRIRIYKNDDYVTYAKLSARGVPEVDTEPFESENIVTSEHVENFKPGDKNKYTVVFWLEGSDLECNDNLLGGEFKFHMEFNSEFKEK